MLSGDIHVNPGPQHNSLTFCQWNLNSITTRDRVKISLIEAYNSIFHHDIIALTETFLNESISDDDICEFLTKHQKR